MMTAGLNEWRLWHVSDVSVITSGVAWVGIWRACFYSHNLPTTESCLGMGITDKFVPVEISVAQVLIMVAAIGGLGGNIIATYAMRSVLFAVESRVHIRLVFSAAGVLYLLTGACSLVPLLWNMSSVLTNRTIDFPPEYHMPPAPARQEVGSAIVIGFIASLLVIFCGVLFLCYRYPLQVQESMVQPMREDKDSLNASLPGTAITLHNRDKSDHHARDNPAFQAEESS